MTFKTVTSVVAGERPTGPLADLQNASPELRARAARILGNMGGPEAIDALIQALGDPDERVLAGAKKALLLLRSHSISSVVRALEHEDSGIRAGAVQLIGEMHYAESLETVRELIRDPAPEVRMAAASALVTLEGRKSADSLARLLADADGSVRRAAVRAIGAIPDGSGAGLLAPRLQDYDPEVRLVTIEALGKIGDVNCIDALRVLEDDPDEQVVKATRAALRAIGDRAVGPFIEKLMTKDIATRLAAFDSLIKQGKAAVLPLLSELEHRNPATRVLFIELLGAIGDDLALPGFIKALGDRNKRVRAAAIAALGKLKSRHTVEALIQMLDEEDSAVADVAAGALIGIGPAASGQLIDLLRAEKSELRTRAARILGEIRDELAVSNLIDALGDSTPWVRAAAATALGNLLAPAAIEPLLDRLLDQHPLVRTAAADALGLLRDVRATSELLWLLEDHQESVRAAATRALGRIGDILSIDPLTGLLNDPVPEVKAAAIEALGNLRVGSVLARFQKFARPLGFEHRTVKRAARRAVAEILKAKEEESDSMKAQLESRSEKTTYR